MGDAGQLVMVVRAGPEIVVGVGVIDVEGGRIDED